MDKLNILVVEDTEEHAEFIIQALKQGLDCAVETVKTGEEALLLMEHTPFDCAIIDYYLPGMGGLEILHLAKRLDHKPPIVMLTNHGNEQVASIAISKGAVGYHQKKELLESGDVCHIVLRAIRQKPAECDDLSNEHRFLSVIRLSSDLICHIHATGAIFLFGEQVYRLLGYTALELDGSKYLDLVHPDDRDRTRLMFQHAIESQQSISGFENRLLAKTGRSVPLIWNCEQEGNSAALMCVARIKPAEEVLQHELALANDLMIMINALVASVVNGTFDWMSVGNLLVLFNRAAGTDSAMVHLREDDRYVLKMFRGRRKRLPDTQVIVPGVGLLGQLSCEPRPKALILNQEEIPDPATSQDGLYVLYAPIGTSAPLAGIVTFAGPASAAGLFRLGLPLAEQLARIINLTLTRPPQ